MGSQALPSASACYPLYTCQTAGTGMGYLYNDLYFYHMNERDLNSIVEYRRRTGDEDG
jgi:hypothetical protein